MNCSQDNRKLKNDSKTPQIICTAIDLSVVHNWQFCVLSEVQIILI